MSKKREASMLNQQRKELITQILEEKQISSRDILLKELSKRNFNIQEEILIHDLTQMNIFKGPRGYYKQYNPDDSIRIVPDSIGTIKRSVLKLENADNLLVIKTIPGAAPPVALILENGPFDEVIGTIGSKNTIFAITKSSEDSLMLKKRLQKTLNFVSGSSVELNKSEISANHAQ
jgi:transcriptional regulator of arginine metabolism